MDTGVLFPELQAVPCPGCVGKGAPDGWNPKGPRRVFMEHDVAYIMGFRVALVMLLQAHTTKFTVDQLKYTSLVNSRRTSSGIFRSDNLAKTPERFGNFDDSTKYGGAVPSEHYLRDVWRLYFSKLHVLEVVWQRPMKTAALSELVEDLKLFFCDSFAMASRFLLFGTQEATGISLFLEDEVDAGVQLELLPPLDLEFAPAIVYDPEAVAAACGSLRQIISQNRVKGKMRGSSGFTKETFPAPLKALLEDSSIIKAGVAINTGATHTLNDYGVKMASTVDLRVLAVSKLVVTSSRTLAGLTACLLGRQLPKDTVRCSRWGSPSLSDEQRDYAIRDAVASALLYEAIHENKDPITSMPSSPFDPAIGLKEVGDESPEVAECGEFEGMVLWDLDHMRDADSYKPPLHRVVDDGGVEYTDNFSLDNLRMGKVVQGRDVIDSVHVAEDDGVEDEEPLDLDSARSRLLVVVLSGLTEQDSLLAVLSLRGFYLDWFKSTLQPLLSNPGGAYHPCLHTGDVAPKAISVGSWRAMKKSIKSLVDGERVTETCDKIGGSSKGGECDRKGKGKGKVEEYTRQDRALGPLQLGLASGLLEEFRTVLELFWKFFVGVGGGGDGGMCMADHSNDVSQAHDSQAYEDSSEPFPGIFNWGHIESVTGSSGA
eukprot:g5383.t1